MRFAQRLRKYQKEDYPVANFEYYLEIDMKTVLKTLALIVSAAVAFTALPAEAQASSSLRYLTCPGGYTAMLGRSGTSCTRVTAGKSTTPICGKLNMRKDWRYSKGQCWRGKVSSTKNVTCRAPYSLRNRRTECIIDGKTAHARPGLFSKNLYVGVPLSCTSSAACTKRVACNSGYTLSKVGGGYECKKSEAASTHTPFCKKFRGHSDWKWHAGQKKCTRKRKKTQVYLAQPVVCKAGYNWDKGSLCKRDGGITYSSPILR